MERLSLKGLRGGGLGWRSFTLDPGRHVKKVFGYEHLSPKESLSSRGEPGMWGEGLVYRGL